MYQPKGTRYERDGNRGYRNIKSTSLMLKGRRVDRPTNEGISDKAISSLMGRTNDSNHTDISHMCLSYKWQFRLQFCNVVVIRLYLGGRCINGSTRYRGETTIKSSSEPQSLQIHGCTPSASHFEIKQGWVSWVRNTELGVIDVIHVLGVSRGIYPRWYTRLEIVSRMIWFGSWAGFQAKLLPLIKSPSIEDMFPSILPPSFSFSSGDCTARQRTRSPSFPR